MSKFGWSMPPGAWESTLPGEEEEGPEWGFCEECGALIRPQVVDVIDAAIKVVEHPGYRLYLDGLAEAIARLRKVANA